MTDLASAPAVRSGRANPSTLWEVVAYFFTNPRAQRLVAITLLAWIIRVTFGGWGWGDLFIVVAVAVVWPVQEWLIHVFILHAKPRKLLGWTIDSHSARKHRDHHLHPNRLDTIFIDLPQQAGGLAFYLIFWHLVAPTEALAVTGVAICMTLACHYEWAHLLAHTSYRPKSRFYRRLQDNHRLHHFRNEHYWFGVSRTGGDWLLRTNPRKEDTPRSETCLTLGVEERES